MLLVMFSKHLGELSVVEAGRRIRDLGFGGVDLTVRPGGHVAPDAVGAALPRAARELADLGLKLPMITTGLVSAADPVSEPTLATAAELGIREVKLGYWPYRPFGTLRAQLDAARKALDGLEGLARRHNIRVSVHTHSGDYLSATAGSVATLLRDRDPHHVGAYVDPCHLTLEGAASGWKQGLDLLQGSLSMVAVKSFGMFPKKTPAGDTAWKDLMVPLRDGVVRWREVAACLKQLGWDGVVSFHSEYQGSHSWRDLTLDELIAQTRDDVAYLRPILRAAGYSA
jgi:sugar phosphate isomerase/epimerase